MAAREAKAAARAVRVETVAVTLEGRKVAVARAVTAEATVEDAAAEAAAAAT